MTHAFLLSLFFFPRVRPTFLPLHHHSVSDHFRAPSCHRPTWIRTTLTSVVARGTVTWALPYSQARARLERGEEEKRSCGIWGAWLDCSTQVKGELGVLEVSFPFRRVSPLSLPRLRPSLSSTPHSVCTRCSFEGVLSFAALFHCWSARLVSGQEQITSGAILARRVPPEQQEHAH